MKETCVSIPLSHFENLVRSNERLLMENVKVTRELYDLRDKVAELERQARELGKGSTPYADVYSLLCKARQTAKTHGPLTDEYTKDVNNLRARIAEIEGPNNRIGQIKHFRNVSKLGLLEAKEFIDGISSHVG